MARALRSSVRPLFVLPVPGVMLRAAKALGLPLPFKRDQIDRLVLPKTYNNANQGQRISRGVGIPTRRQCRNPHPQSYHRAGNDVRTKSARSRPPPTSFCTML
jgi:hypothetical protein